MVHLLYHLHLGDQLVLRLALQICCYLLLHEIHFLVDEGLHLEQVLGAYH
jgi:hypothetical protein